MTEVGRDGRDGTSGGGMVVRHCRFPRCVSSDDAAHRGGHGCRRAQVGRECRETVYAGDCLTDLRGNSQYRRSRRCETCVKSIYHARHLRLHLAPLRYCRHANDDPRSRTVGGVCYAQLGSGQIAQSWIAVCYRCRSGCPWLEREISRERLDLHHLERR